MNLFVIKYNKQNFIVGLFLLAILLFSEDTLTFGTNANAVSLLKYVIYIILFSILCSRISFNLAIRKNTLCLLIILCSIFLTSLINLDFTGGYVYQFFIVTLAFLIVKNSNLDNYIFIYSKILFLLCCISLLVFIVATNFSWLLGYFPVHENIGGVQFTNLYVACVFKGVGEVRNTGIFREPGVYIIYILLGVIFELFYFTKPRIKYLVLFSITLLTTYSTAGILVFMLVVAAYLISTNNRSRGEKVTIVLAFFSLMIYVYINDSIASNIFDKMSRDSSSYRSTLARIASIVVNFEIFLENPLFGLGLTDCAELFGAYAYKIYGIHLSAHGTSTNSFLSLFATYGVVYGGMVVFSFYCFAGLIVRQKFIKVLLFVSFLLMFSNEDMRYSLFFNVLVFFGFKYMSNKHRLRASSVRI